MNLDRYLQRIDYRRPLRPDAETLTQLHFHHATHISFENLDIQLGRPILLDVESLQKKLVENQRGGYCFEQNMLFKAALESIGFAVIACEARVRLGMPQINPRTHMLLITRLEDQSYLCDVGFGGEGLLYPVRIDSESHAQFAWRYRVVKDGDLLVLQSARVDSWLDLYAFAPHASPDVDFKVANWYTSTHPDSRFVQTLTAQLPTPEARYILRNTTFIIQFADREETHNLSSADELLDVLKQYFRLDFPRGTTFRNPRFA